MSCFLFPRQSVSTALRNSDRTKHPYRRRLRFERLEARAMLSVNGDFNDDGFDDLAIGVPGENLAFAAAGAVNVIYGSLKGLEFPFTREEFWHLDSPGVNGHAAPGDFFGSALAVGDFDGDGFSDLAIGIPGKMVSGQVQAGAVSVLYGSASGLRAGTVDQLWTQDSPGINDMAEPSDCFGAALAAGDFNGDGRDDLAIGAFEEVVGGAGDAGMVNVLYGSASGLTNVNDQHWHQNSPGINDTAETGDNFGRALAAGDFDGDGFDDLAIGVPREHVGNISDAGMVNVIYGSASGLTNVDDQHWHQNRPGVADSAEFADEFGSSLAAGDFSGDGFDDLAIGVPRENAGDLVDAGRVNLLYGSASKLHTGTGIMRKQYTAQSLGFSVLETGFGTSLAAGDFNGDGFDDLAVGANNLAIVIFGNSVFGLISTGREGWRQHQLGGTTEDFEDFGAALTTGDYDGDGRADLAIGAPRDDAELGGGSVGSVFVLYAFGLSSPRVPFWHQDLLSSSDGAETNDLFGNALG